MNAQREVPKKVYSLPLGQRIRWARKTAGLSHDRLVIAIGRSNRGHLVKIEQGIHVPRQDLRDVIADATDVPRDLFAVEGEDLEDPFWGGANAGADGRGRARGGAGVRPAGEVVA